MSKKIVLIVISVILVMGMTGCSKVEKENISNDKPSNVIEKSKDEKEKAEKEESENQKELEVKDKEEKDKEDEKLNQEKEDKEETKKEEIQDKPISSKKVIVIDPGHSSVGNSGKEPIAPDSQTTKAKDVLGATGSYTKIPEHKTTVPIALLLEKELQAKGFEVVMTKREVSKSISNIERATIGNESNADLVVRIHADSSTDHSVKGASILVPPNNKYTGSISGLSNQYGEKIINTYTQELGIKNRGVITRDDMTGFNWSKVPVVILEMGFLSNEQEDNFISNTSNHEAISKAIANGVYKCFE